MVQLLVDSVFSTGMSGVDKTNEHEKLGRQREEKKKVGNILVVVLFLLFSPVLVELVDLHSSISLLKQVKCLYTTT